jgi:hypothetical protein
VSFSLVAAAEWVGTDRRAIRGVLTERVFPEAMVATMNALFAFLAGFSIAVQLPPGMARLGPHCYGPMVAALKKLSILKNAGYFKKL